MSRHIGSAVVTEEELIEAADIFELPFIGQFVPPGPFEEIEIAGLGQMPTMEEQEIAEELTEFLPRIGQRSTPGEEVIAEELTQFLPRHVGDAGLGIIGLVASAGLQAAMPSVKSSLTKMVSTRGAKAARSDRNAALMMLDGLVKMAAILHDGTDEMMALMKAGQRVDPFQIQEADMAAQQSMKAWQPGAEGYAALAGTGPDELGAAIPAHEAQMVAQERLFLEGCGIALGRSASRKRADRLGWLTHAQNIFLDHMRAVNTSLNALAKSAGITRLTASESGIALAEGVEALTPPTEPRTAAEPRKAAVPPTPAPLVPAPPAPAPAKKKLPLGLIIGGTAGGLTVIGIALTLLRLLRR